MLDEPDVVYLYEAYVDHAAFEAHKANEPFKRFIDEIVPHVIEPPTFILPFSEALRRTPTADRPELRSALAEHLRGIHLMGHRLGVAPPHAAAAPHMREVRITRLPTGGQPVTTRSAT